ncbi:MAG: InlB B-repeat-containing protein, partial [Acholeplasmatales bacterium]|nr:InlB B-repeat-containing protein [Acholeplasmatales bacterium]
MFKKIFFSALSCICLAIVAITVSYAWYITKESEEFKSPLITGKSTAAYYAGGDGSKEKPYKIANARHLYNFSWLQYLGTYNKDYDNDGEIDQYYFEVINDIDCEGLVLPPIGTTNNPFLGNFDGNGYTITDLLITNNFAELVKHPSSISDATKFTGCEIIGFFGVIGKYAGFVNAIISREVNKVANLHLDQITIKNSCTNTLAGIIAGFVNGNVSNIGVHYGNIKLANSTSKLTNFDNISSYTLIGDYDEDLVSWEDKPSNENESGNSVDFGGSLNFLEMVTRMGYMTNNNWTIPSITYNPGKDDSSHPNQGNYLSLVVDNKLDNAYYASNTVESIPSNNIGVLTGQDAKILAKATAANVLASDMYVLDSSGTKVHPSKLTYLEDGSTSNTSYTYSTDIVDADIYTKDFTTGSTKPADSLVTNLDESIREDVINILSDDSQMLYGARFSGQIEGNNWIEIQDIYIAGAKRKITVPPKAIWFAAQQTGYAKVIFGAYNGSTQGIGVYRIERTVSDGTVENQFFTELSNRKVNTTGNAQATGGAQNVKLTHIDSAYVNTMSDGSTKFTYNEADPSAKSSKCIWIYTGFRDNVTDDRLYYVEFPIIQGYEYAFGDQNSGGGMILYMDIGQNGADGTPPSEDPVLKDSAIEGLDFVYLNSNNSFSSTSTDYSAVFFRISGTTNGLTEFYFRRNNDNEDNYAGSEGIVLFFSKNESGGEWTTTSSGKTDGKSSLDWSYAGTKGQAGDSGNYKAIDCEVLSGTKVSGGIANSNTGASTKKTVTYVYRKENEDGTYELIQITKGTVTNGYAITIPNFEITGYVITGWYSDEALTNEYNFSKAVTENIILYASVDKVTTYTVTFKDGNNVLGTCIVNSGSYATFTDPRKESYVFSHWVDDSGNTIDLSNTNITSDISFTVVWNDAYNIHYSYNLGGNTEDVIIDTIELKKGDLLTKPSNPSLAGYKFINWYTDANYTDVFDFNTAPSTNAEDSTITIYAKFEAIKYYTITYQYTDKDGNTITIMTEQVEENTTTTAPQDPTRTGFVFAGWYSDSSCETVFNFNSAITKDTIVYADWDEALTVTFAYEDGTVIDTKNVLSGNTITVTDIKPAMTGYKFNGNWYLKTGDTVSTTPFDFSEEIEENITLIPGWIKTYTITYVLD